MALSSCIRCNGSQFELRERRDIANANYAMFLVQCASCGGVVGATPFYDPGITAVTVKDGIKKIAQHLNVYLGPDFD